MCDNDVIIPFMCRKEEEIIYVSNMIRYSATV